MPLHAVVSKGRPGTPRPGGGIALEERATLRGAELCCRPDTFAAGPAVVAAAFDHVEFLVAVEAVVARQELAARKKRQPEGIAEATGPNARSVGVRIAVPIGIALNAPSGSIDPKDLPGERVERL